MYHLCLIPSPQEAHRGEQNSNWSVLLENLEAGWHIWHMLDGINTAQLQTLHQITSLMLHVKLAPLILLM